INLIAFRDADDHDMRVDYYLSLLQIARNELEKLLDDQSFVTISMEIRASCTSDDRIPPDLAKYVFDGKTVHTAVIRLIRYIDNVNSTIVRRLSSAPPSTDISALRRAIPEHVASPIQSLISDGKIFVADQSFAADDGDGNNASDARATLLASGGKIIDELRRSNCDRRLVETVIELQSDLAAGASIIRLGLVNIGCEAVCRAFEQELPYTLCGMLLGHTRGVSMYLAPFSDWRRFSEKALAAELSAADIERVTQTAQHLIAGLEANPDIADAEVPKTIRALQRLIADPRLATKRAAYALMRTIENLVAKIFQYAAKFIETLAVKTSDRLSTATSRTIVVALMTLAVAGAIEISPLAAKIADTAWLKTAAEIVQKLIDELAH
ncbi:MAG: hypothetical protein ACREMY_19660, partial [bacterium]